MSVASIQITERAIAYLAGIAERQNCRDLRVGVQHPGTNVSQCYLSFASELEDDDEIVDFKAFRVRFRRAFARFIDGLQLDYRENRMGGQIKLRAPNLHNLEEPPVDADLSVRANWVLHAFINPQLAEHQGSALVDRVEGNRVWLKFGGNCLGCGNAESTLVEFVEKTLKEKIPEIEAVSEVTMH